MRDYFYKYREFLLYFKISNNFFLSNLFPIFVLHTKKVIKMEKTINFYSKEIQIMRQSQQKMAFDFCKSKGYTPTLTELQRITDIFVEICLRPLDNELKSRILSLDKWIEKKVKESVEEVDGVLL